MADIRCRKLLQNLFVLKNVFFYKLNFDPGRRLTLLSKGLVRVATFVLENA